MMSPPSSGATTWTRLNSKGDGAEAMRLGGWKAETTKGSGDQGVDVLAERAGVRVVLQRKRYNKSVGNKADQEAFAAKTFAKAQYAAVSQQSVHSGCTKSCDQHRRATSALYRLGSPKSSFRIDRHALVGQTLRHN